ncbi:MAG: carbohydrate ABC transporter permease [Oscillospiraceae bacterium]|nr:carbohydrate ABC transporter permease [Oscillospiraceae bacterium]
MSEKNLPKKYREYFYEIIFIVFTAVAMIPVYYLLITTFKTPQEATNAPLALPKIWRFDGYAKAWRGMNYPNAFKNSFIITFCSLGGTLLTASMAAFTLARKRNKLNTVLFYVLLAGLMIPFQMSILAQYRLVQSLGLMNNILSVIFINIAVNLPMSVFFIRNFIIASVPVQIEEAAVIDGCSVLRTFMFITLPLLRPVIATLAIMNSIGIWNDFLTPLMFLQSQSSRTILLEVNANVGRFNTNWTDMFPMMVLGVLPLVLFFLIMQRHIIKGISTGAVKG